MWVVHRRAWTLLVAVSAVVLLTFGVHADGAPKSLEPHECVAKGFDPALLSCRTCNTLDAELVAAADDSDAEDVATLKRECRECCNTAIGDDDAGGEGDVIASAVIGYDTRWANPLIESFAEKHMPGFRGKVTTRHRSHVMPRVLLFKEGETTKPVQTVNVQGWEAGLIQEFLAKKLNW